MTAPLVSVIIPVFNGADFLADAIQSVLAQTYRPMEIIVVDDGSTDASPEVARRFSAAIRYHAQPNRGTAAARNEGLRFAQGSHFAFLDQDDVWLPDKLADQMNALAESPWLDAVFGMVRQFRADEREESPPLAGYLPSAMLIRRDAFQRVGPFGTGWIIGEWADWYARAGEVGLRMALLPRVVARRRLHAANKGLDRPARREYVRLLKASLDRRRAGRAREEADVRPTRSGRSAGRSRRVLRHDLQRV